MGFNKNIICVGYCMYSTKEMSLLEARKALLHCTVTFICEFGF